MSIMFCRILKPNEALGAVIGHEPMARGKIVKALHVYMKQNDLQDPNNQSMVICDDKLKAIYKTDTISVFKMVSNFSKITTPTNDYDQEMLKEQNARRDEKHGINKIRARKLLARMRPEDRAELIGEPDGKVAELETKIIELEMEVANADTREIGDPTLCVVCAAADRSHMFQPCNHIACCGKCANYIEMDTQECPVCKKDVESIIKVFLA